MNSLIIRDKKTGAIEFSDEFKLMSGAALVQSALIGAVDSPEDQQVAVTAQAAHKRILDIADEQKADFKRPFLEICAAVEKAHKEGTRENKLEFIRLSIALEEYQEEQRKLNRIALKERNAAIAQIEKQYSNPLLQQQAIEAIGPAPKVEKADGQRVTDRWSHEVVDIHLLYKMHPGLVTMKANTAEINATITALALAQEPGIVPKIAGLRIWPTVKCTVVNKKEPKAIEV